MRGQDESDRRIGVGRRVGNADARSEHRPRQDRRHGQDDGRRKAGEADGAEQAAAGIRAARRVRIILIVRTLSMRRRCGNVRVSRLRLLARPDRWAGLRRGAGRGLCDDRMMGVVRPAVLMDGRYAGVVGVDVGKRRRRWRTWIPGQEVWGRGVITMGRVGGVPDRGGTAHRHRASGRRLHPGSWTAHRHARWAGAMPGAGHQAAGSQLSRQSKQDQQQAEQMAGDAWHHGVSAIIPSSHDFNSN
jgi:hypothetical protein